MFSAHLRRTAVVATGCLLLATGGCEQVRNTFGLNKNPPDEFRVVSRAPLALPPEYQLRPPQPGATRPQEGTPRDQASQTIFGRDGEAERDVVQSANGLTAGERALLTRAVADEASSDIRQVVDAETRQLNEEAQSFVDTLVFWREPQSPAQVVDAESESRRLQENAAVGEDASRGETPTIERRKRGFLEGIF
jgi:hypothetical protein